MSLQIQQIGWAHQDAGGGWSFHADEAHHFGCRPVFVQLACAYVASDERDWAEHVATCGVRIPDSGIVGAPPNGSSDPGGSE